MPLANYGLLIGKVRDHGPQQGHNPHYLVEVTAAQATFRVALNLESTLQGTTQSLQYQIAENFAAEPGPASDLVTGIRAIVGTHSAGGFLVRSLSSNVPAVDYVRGKFTDPASFLTLPASAQPQDNAFSDRFKQAAQSAKEDSGTWIAVFGTGYPDQDDRADGADPTTSSFGFTGVDNIHMNQGSYLRIGRISDSHYYENGPNQDGAVLFLWADGTVTAFFTKFQSQDALTDVKGNPVHTGVAELDVHVAGALTTGAVLPRQENFEAVGPIRTLARPVRTKPAGAPTPPLNAPPFGTEGDGFIFADPDPDAVPARKFLPDDDGNTYKSAYVVEFSRADAPKPEPVPAPNAGTYPVLKLAQVLRPSVISQIQAAGQICFHSVGDTGAPKATSVPHEGNVTNLMVQDLLKPTADQRPAFLFHLGDVVYFYGEEPYYYDQFYKPFEKYAAPVFAIPGNHDGLTYNATMVSLEPFRDAFCAPSPTVWSGSGGIQRSSMIQPGVYFTLDAPFVSIVGLYSNCSESTGYLDQQQLLFLRTELARLKKLRTAGTFVAFLLAVHHPPYSLTQDTGHSNAMRQAMDAEFLAANLWPDAVLSGHAHIYQRMTRAVTNVGASLQIPYIVAGSGGYAITPTQEIDKTGMQQLNQTDPSFKLHQYIDGFGYLYITVTAPGSGKTPTLTIDFRNANTSAGKNDSCTVNLKTHQLM
jgi:uncharacterized protein YukJ